MSAASDQVVSKLDSLSISIRAQGQFFCNAASPFSVALIGEEVEILLIPALPAQQNVCTNTQPRIPTVQFHCVCVNKTSVSPQHASNLRCAVNDGR